MKTTVSLKSWEIKACKIPMEPGRIDPDDLSALPGEWIFIGDAAEVQEALIAKKQLSDSVVEDGHSEYCNWISETDWVYRCVFDREHKTDRAYIRFMGIDTVGDVYLNNQHMGQSRSMYLDFRFEAADLKERNNELLVYIHSHKKMLDIYEKNMKEHWRGNVTADMMLRKSRDYGAAFGYHPIGIFDEVFVEYIDKIEILDMDMRIDFSHDYSEALIRVSAEGSGPAEKICVKFSIEEDGEKSGANQISVTARATGGAETWRAEDTLRIKNPRLWWPKNYGDHPLCRITCAALADDRVCDEITKVTGLRKVRLTGSMRFEVNGVEVYWWGSGITPIKGLSNRYNHQEALDLIERFDDSNMNALRIWGPGRAYPDAFYHELDKRGIMVWQDFPTGTWQMPDTPEYTRLYSDEAAYMIRRLKAHPSIMLWCGGNEHIYMCELDGKTERIGFDMLHYGYRQICGRYDPERYYHVSSPYEGRYANDPEFGDSHGSRAYCAYTPGESYGGFFSEDIRVFPPQYKSAIRFMKDDVWDNDYVDTKPFGTEFAMPRGWEKHFSNNGHWKLGPVDQYYSARTAEELIYKYAAAAAQDLYSIGARARTGNPPHRAGDKRQRAGHLFWKFNDPWPRFYCSFYDYYGECTLPYYAVKRVFAPFLIHIEVGDHVYVWGVNDTRTDRAGFLSVKICDLETGAVVRELTIPAAVPAGKSVILTDLDSFGPIKWKSVLYASFSVSGGTIEASAHGYVTHENMLPFPRAEISLSYEGGCLAVRTDTFARTVELSGNYQGDEFGWYFDDNYFDLLPFEVKRVKVSSRHPGGIISARAHYSDKITSIKV